MSIIELTNLTKYYGKSRGIIDLSFTVEQGEIFGFIGPNGSGKSTTIRTILGLIFPTSGSAKIFGYDCVKKGYKIRSRVGYLPSEVFYYEGMKVINLLKYSASFYPNVDNKRIFELAEILDLELNRKIEDLSYGNRKKVGIIQGLLHHPDLIILDEPTSGLDPLIQQNFFNLIREENRKGASVLFSSHVLSEVQKICSRVAIIKEGRLVSIENMNTMKNSNYKRFKLDLENPPASSAFNIDGITNFELIGNRLSFLFKGDINRVIAIIQGIKLENLIVEEPSLEEIFLHYYEKEI